MSQLHIQRNKESYKLKNARFSVEALNISRIWKIEVTWDKATAPKTSSVTIITQLDLAMFLIVVKERVATTALLKGRKEVEVCLMLS